MPRFRFKMAFTAPSQATFDSVKALVVSKLPPPNRIFDKPADWIQSLADPTVSGVFDCRLNRVQEYNSLWTDVVTILPTIGGLGVTGKIHRHLCSHDDPEVYSCRDDPRSIYEEVTI